MKNVLVVAALTAALFAAPAAPALSAEMHMDKVSPVCLLLPLLPDCIKAWHDMGAADMGAAHMTPAKMTTTPMTQMMTPMMDCTTAPAGSGHLYDCPKM